MQKCKVKTRRQEEMVRVVITVVGKEVNPKGKRKEMMIKKKEKRGSSQVIQISW